MGSDGKRVGFVGPMERQGWAVVGAEPRAPYGEWRAGERGHGILRRGLRSRRCLHRRLQTRFRGCLRRRRRCRRLRGCGLPARPAHASLKYSKMRGGFTIAKRYPATISNRKIRAYLTPFTAGPLVGSQPSSKASEYSSSLLGSADGAGSGSSAGWCSGMTAGCSRARSQSAGGCGALLAALGIYLRRIPRWPPRGEREADGVHSSGDGGGALAWARTGAGLFKLQLVLAAGARSRCWAAARR